VKFYVCIIITAVAAHAVVFVKLSSVFLFIGVNGVTACGAFLCGKSQYAVFVIIGLSLIFGNLSP
jgi:hypothetical protein